MENNMEKLRKFFVFGMLFLVIATVMTATLATADDTNTIRTDKTSATSVAPIAVSGPESGFASSDTNSYVVDSNLIQNIKLNVGESAETKDLGISIKLNSIWTEQVCPHATSDTAPCVDNCPDSHPGSACENVIKANLTITYSSSSDTAAVVKDITISLHDGTSLDGNFWIAFLNIDKETALFSISKIPVETAPIAVSYPIDGNYACAAGCKEVADGCLCPKILVSKSPEGYTITGQTNPVDVHQIKLEPGDNALTAVDSAGATQRVGGGNLADGVSIPVASGNIELSTDTQKLETYITDKNVKAMTHETLISDASGLAIDSNGREDVKILPAEAVDKAKKTLGLNYSDLQLKTQDGIAVYDITGTRDAKLFGFIPVKEDVRTTLNAVDGNTQDTSAPWYDFLTVPVPGK